MTTPTPRILYIHDDLSHDLRRTGRDAGAAILASRLLELVQREPHVVVITLEDQLRLLLAGGDHAPFALALGIGRAGEAVAEAVHARTGWFPAIGRVGVTREEAGAGYRLTTDDGRPLAAHVGELRVPGPLALVDDTVFSGMTMRTVLEALPPSVRARTHAFCLRGVRESIERIERLCPISAGVAAPGRVLDDVSFINASGLVRRGAIRRAGRPPLAFFERPEWMAAWFPDTVDDVIAVCRALNEHLEPPGWRVVASGVAV